MVGLFGLLNQTLLLMPNPKRAKDTRNRPWPEPVVEVGNDGHKYVELNHLKPHQRKKLAAGMEATEAGRKHIQTMRAAKEDFGPLWNGSTFRITRPQYTQYMKDAEESAKEGDNNG